MVSRFVRQSILLVVMCAACAETEPPTRVVIELGSDLGSQLRSLEVAIRDPNDRSTGDKHSFDLDAHRLPFSFAVAPHAAGGSGFVVIATGWGAQRKYLAQVKARVKFESREVTTVGLWLAARCTQRCSDGQSCSLDPEAEAGSCAPIQAAKSGKATPPPPAAGSGADGPPALGGRCSASDELACAGSSRLICRDRKWSAHGECAADTRCSGGECLPIPVACRGKAPDSRSCDGADRVHCDDELQVTREACPAHARCDPAAPARCRCEPDYQEAQDGSCLPPDHCPAGACAGGKCVSAADSFSCTCGMGYSGTGTKSCTAISCAASGVCGPYECRDRAPSYECIGQFADWPMPERLSATTADVSTGGVVIDKATGLMWQRELQSCSATNVTCTWKDAVPYCTELKLAGYDDWRLPTPIELLSIMDSEVSNPAVDLTLFPETPGTGFWTAIETHDNPKEEAWYVNAYHGEVGQTPKTRENRARCVRLVR